MRQLNLASPSLRQKLIIGLFALLFTVFSANASNVFAQTDGVIECSLGNNRIVNGDVETDSSATGDGTVDHDVSGWDAETGQFTVVRYTAGGGFPTASSPGPATRGAFFFAGGQAAASSASQTISVADCAPRIDAGNQKFSLSGFLGGFENQEDQAQVTVTFKDSMNATLGTTSIGPVTATDRNNITGLLSRIAGNTIPAGTRSVEVVLLLTKISSTGTYNDGYADNLSFRLLPDEFNARDEFSLTQGGTTGVWRYGYTASDTSNTVVEYTLNIINDCGGSPAEGWRFSTGGDNTPVIYRYQTSATCNGTPPDSLFVHPGLDGQRTVLRWVAPAPGTYQLTGVLQRANPNATSDLRILKNQTDSLFTGNVNSANQQGFNVTVTVAANDTIDFSVGWGNGSYNGDGSALNVVVSQPVTACQTAPANLQVFVPGENSPSDVQSVNTNAALVGDAKYANIGKVGRAFEFDGNSDYVRIEDNQAQKPASQLTVEGWFKFNNFNNFPHLVAKPRRGNQFDSFALWYNGGMRIGYQPTSGGFVELETGFTPATGVWNHYAYVLNTDDTGTNANTAKLYVNGAEVYSTTGSFAPILYDTTNIYPLLIGADFETNNPTYFLNGNADEVSIYSRALAQTEIFNIVQQASFGKCPPANCAQTPNNLVSWFAGEQNALDSRSNNHGTLQNGATFAIGKVGQAFGLDGVDDRILVADPVPASLQIQNDISLNAWIYVTEYPTTGERLGMIVGSQYDVTASGASIFLDGRTNPDGQPAPPGHIHFQIGDGSFHVTNAQTAVPLNQWVHISANRKGGENARIYYNGVLQPSTSAPWAGTITYNGAWFAIGQQKDINRPFKGLIDEVSVFNRSLTQPEVQSVVNADSSGMCKPSPLNPTTNQIAWFSGDGDANDFAGGDQNGTNNGTTFAVGKVGQAFRFTADPQHVSIPDSPALRPTNFTIESWVKSTDNSGIRHIFAKTLGSATADSYVFWVNNGALNGAICPNASTCFVISTTAPNVGEWHHVALTFDDATDSLRIYVDGVQAVSGTTTFSIGYDTHPVTIGADFANEVVADSWRGLIDELSFYDRALNGSEIAAVYNAGFAGKLKEKVITPVAPSLVQKNEKTEAANFAPTVTTTVTLSSATVTFQQLNSPGVISQSNVDLGSLPRLPASAVRYTGLAYDFSTTADYRQTVDGDVKICFNLPALANFNASSLRILHLENVGGNLTWVNRTAANNTLNNFCTGSLRSLSPFAIVEFAPTAATVSLSGRATVGKRGIRNALVTLTESSGATRTVSTGVNGTYRFTDIAAGQNVIVTIRAKRFVFVPDTQVVHVIENLDDVNFAAQDGGLSAP